VCCWMLLYSVYVGVNSLSQSTFHGCCCFVLLDVVVVSECTNMWLS